MPSRVKGEIILNPKGNIISWRLVPRIVKDIKKKWESIKTTLQE